MCTDKWIKMTTKGNGSKSILVLCQLYYPELASTGQTLTELCSELVTLGWQVEVVCAQPTTIQGSPFINKLIHHNGVTIRRVWATRFPKLNLLGRILNQLTYSLSIISYLIFKTAKRPILVLTNPPFLPFSCLFANLFKINLKFILLIFDVYPETAIHLGVIKQNGLIQYVWNKLNTLSFRASAKIIVIGRCMRDVIQEKGRLAGLDLTNKIELIHIWTDDCAIMQDIHTTPTTFIGKGLEGKFIVLYSGNMGRFHDLETVLEAAQKLRDHPDIRFSFIGEGAKKKLVSTTIAQLNLTNCMVDSFVPREELGALLHSANVGLATLLSGHEGLSVPSKTLGLMAAGLPVIAIMENGSEIARMCCEGNFGKVIKPGDADQLVKELLDLYTNPEKCKTMGINGRTRLLEGLTLHKAAQAYSKLFDSI